jgi:dGTPase
MTENAYEREHADPLAERQAPLEVDRQRVVHAAAFRRLQHKTQVFAAQLADHFRSRLTHSLEVAHVARRLANVLGLNAELAETVALAHDLGHPPFGHAGERALQDCLAERGGFEHNAHTLRTVEYLEHPYPAFRGLNLTRVVRECLAKHSTKFDIPGAHPLQDGEPPPAEGLVVDLADRLAYGIHDLQDGLYAGLVAPADLLGLRLWQEVYAGPPVERAQVLSHLRPAMDRLETRLVTDVAEQWQASAKVDLSDDGQALFEPLEAVLLEKVYRCPALRASDREGYAIVQALFAGLMKQPTLLPQRYAERTQHQDLERVVADYVAGMTDRFCRQEHQRVTESG